MEYIVNGNKYSLSYSDLKERYLNIAELSNEAFMNRLPEILHTACIICYVKEIPSSVVLS